MQITMQRAVDAQKVQDALRTGPKDKYELMMATRLKPSKQKRAIKDLYRHIMRTTGESFGFNPTIRKYVLPKNAAEAEGVAAYHLRHIVSRMVTAYEVLDVAATQYASATLELAADRVEQAGTLLAEALTLVSGGNRQRRGAARQAMEDALRQ